MKMKLQTTKYKNFIKNNSGTLLTIAGGLGMIATTALSIKAGMDIKEKKLDTKESIKACIPAVIGCAGSIACVVAGDALNRKQKSELLATCAAIGSSYSCYRNEIIKRYGEDVDNEIVDTVSNSCYRHHMAPEVSDKVCHWIIDMCVDGLPIYEIDARERDIIHAEYHVNRNYILGSEQSINDLYKLLGIECSTKDLIKQEMYGWKIDDSEVYFLDFEHEKIDDNTFRLTPLWAPWFDFQNLNMFGESDTFDSFEPFGDA